MGRPIRYKGGVLKRHDAIQPRCCGEVVVRFSVVALIVVAALLLVPWAAMVWWRTHEPQPALPTPTVPVDSKLHRCKPGPWGELEFNRILIEPPAEFIVTRFPLQPEVRWVLKGATPESIGMTLASLPFTADQRRELLAPDRVERFADGMVLRPTREFVLGMNPELRGAWYKILGADPANAAQFKPSRIRSTVADEWFAGSTLQPATIALVKKLVYSRAGALLFSDQETVLPLLPSDAERSLLLKTLARKAALMMHLRIRPDSNIDQLVDYWTRPGRAKDIEPLLRSLPKLPEGFPLDVAHLLPRFARARLYTYPTPTTDSKRALHDCHWTSLNFFATTPDDRYADAEVVASTLEQHYYNAPGDPTFGDVILFANERGETKHSCVYVADDIVFTKNGGDADIPWILMELADLVPWYGIDEPVRLQVYRRRLE